MIQLRCHNYSRMEWKMLAEALRRIVTTQGAVCELYENEPSTCRTCHVCADLMSAARHAQKMYNNWKEEIGNG